MKRELITQEFKNKLEDYIYNQHTTEEYVSYIKELTGIEFAKDSPLYDFYVAPASTKFHGAYEHGLVQHSLAVYYSALKLARSFGIEHEDVDENACIFHDLVKAGLYLPGIRGYTYNTNQVILPHGSESLLRIKEHNIPIKSRAWEMAVVYHMGAFEHDNIEMFSRACDQYKEVLFLHTADMMATKIYKH